MLLHIRAHLRALFLSGQVLERHNHVLEEFVGLHNRLLAGEAPVQHASIWCALSPC